MSFNTITIVRSYPVINGFVQLPNNLEMNKSAVSVEEALLSDPSLAINRLTAQSGGARLAGSKHGLQEWLELVPEVVGCCVTCCSDSSIESENLKDRQPEPPEDRNPPGEAEYNRPPCDCYDVNSSITLSLLYGIYGCCNGQQGIDQPPTEITLYRVYGEGQREGECWWYGVSDFGYTFTITQVNDGRGTCYWYLVITCPDGTIIWTGTKTYGATPDGNYTAAYTCDPNLPVIPVGFVYPEWWAIPDDPDGPTGISCNLIDCDMIEHMTIGVQWTGTVDSQCCEMVEPNTIPMRPVEGGGCNWRGDDSVIEVYLVIYTDNLGNCYYMINLYCVVSQELIYSGYYVPVAANNYTPAGVYTKTSGCSDLTVQVTAGFPN